VCVPGKNRKVPFDFAQARLYATRVSNLGRVPQVRAGVPPDFLLCLLALAYFMRLSLMKAAHAALGGAPCRKSGNLG
jgi:hypothetical protein